MQELFDEIKPYIDLDKSNHNWTVFRWDIPKDLFLKKISLKKKDSKIMDDIVRNYLKENAKNF